MDAMSEFNPRTYPDLEQRRRGRWHLPGPDELAGQPVKAARLMKEFNELANTEGVPVGGHRFV